jgi:hypothetical protein
MNLTDARSPAVPTSRSQRRIERVALILNAGYFLMMLWWTVRRPQNLVQPLSYLLLALPFLCVYAVRLRPTRWLAIAAGLCAGFMNLLLLLVTAFGSGISGRGEGEFLLTFLFTVGNAVLVFLAWMAAFTQKSGVSPAIPRKSVSSGRPL